MAIAVRDLRAVRPERSAEASRDFDDFYRAYARRVRGIVRRRINDPELAAEVVQDTFLRAHVHFDRLDPSRSAWPWLATVASNLCVDALRRAARDGGGISDAGTGLFSEESDPEAIDWQADPAEAFESSLRADAVRCALASVPARQRQVLLLKDDEGWTAEQIARLDGVSPEGIKSLVRRARVTFRESYERVAEERGLRAGFAVLGAPLARLRARLQRVAAGRIPTFPFPALALPLDAGSLVGAAALSVLLSSGVAAAAPIATESARHEAPAPAAASADGGSVTSADAAPVSIAKVGVSVAPEGAPLAADANASLQGEAARRTLEVIIAAKTGAGGADGNTRTQFDCDYSQLRTAVCDAVEQAPVLAPAE